MPEGHRTEVQLGRELHEPSELPSAAFLQRVGADGLQHVRTSHWPTAETSLDGLGDPLLRTSTRGGEGGLYEIDGVLVDVSLWGAHVTLSAAAHDPRALASVFEQVEKLFPPPDPSSAHEVPVTFWMYTPQGPRPSWRAISVPAWEEIESNYPEATRQQLSGLLSEFQPARGGQLLLWHGEAGTGKTFALRALAWEWRAWCQVHYIVDPDSFFGEHADYLMSVLLEPPFPMMVGEGFGPAVGIGVSQAVVSLGAHTALDEEPDEDDNRLWRLLVMEDTGELLAADARDRTGQGLSRFLNVVDGLIGQGLRVIVLVTTNEEIRKLHPAVARPGRCAANVLFESLSVEEASRWLRGRGLVEEATANRTLASLYAQAEGRDPTETVLIGFGTD